MWPPAVKLQKTRSASRAQPWLGSIQYCPVGTPHEWARLGIPLPPLGSPSPSGSRGWSRCSSLHTSPGCSAVPGGWRSCSSSRLSDDMEASTSSRPSSGLCSALRCRSSSPCSSARGPWGWGGGNRKHGLGEPQAQPNWNLSRPLGPHPSLAPPCLAKATHQALDPKLSQGNNLAGPRDTHRGARRAWWAPVSTGTQCALWREIIEGVDSGRPCPGSC